MKNLIITAMISILATINVQAETSNVEMCKTAIDVAQTYEDMGKADEAMFDSYKKDVVANCGIISAKV